MGFLAGVLGYVLNWGYFLFWAMVMGYGLYPLYAMSLGQFSWLRLPSWVALAGVLALLAYFFGWFGGFVAFSWAGIVATLVAAVTLWLFAFLLRRIGAVFGG